MINHPEQIKKGTLEIIFQDLSYANKIRDKYPLLSPICTWGSRVRRCTRKATVRYRISSEFKWRYACDKHAFHPEYHDILGRGLRNYETSLYEGDRYEWEWIGEEREPPKYRVPLVLRPERLNP